MARARFAACERISVYPGLIELSDARAGSGLPIDLLAVGPKLLEAVIFSGRFIEEVDDDIAVVQKNPIACSEAFHSQPLFAKAFFERLGDFLGNGVKLPMASASNDEEEIENGGQMTQVEQNDILPAVIVSNLGRSRGNQKPAIRLAGRLLGPARLSTCQTRLVRD